MRKDFLYLRDPLFIGAFAAFLINRFLIEPMYFHRFFNFYANDLICVPFLLPIVLKSARLCKLRRNDDRPKAYEIFLAVVTWSILFEIIFPSIDAFSHWIISDPVDILCYCLGGWLALVVWQLYYRTPA